MQNLKNLRDDDLLHSTKAAVRAEQEKTLIVLEHLREIDSRLLFAKLGYSSLFQYGLEELGYSEAEIQLRINAMRITRAVPQIMKAVERGTLSLTNMNMANTYFRKAEIKSLEEKLVVLQSLENKSKREGEKILTALLPAAKEEEKITFVLTEDLKTQLQALKELTGITNNQRLLEFALSKALRKTLSKTLSKTLEQKPAPPRPDEVNKAKPSATRTLSPATRKISVTTKRIVLQRDQARCTYTSASGKRCEETKHLQYDHIEPFALGGKSTAENLRLLCPSHNALEAQQIFGEKSQKYRGS